MQCKDNISEAPTWEIEGFLGIESLTLIKQSKVNHDYVRFEILI